MATRNVTPDPVRLGQLPFDLEQAVQDLCESGEPVTAEELAALEMHGGDNLPAAEELLAGLIVSALATVRAAACSEPDVAAVLAETDKIRTPLDALDASVRGDGPLAVLAGLP